MALAQLSRSPVHDLGPDMMRFVAVFVTTQANIAADTPAYGTGYTGIGSTAEPLNAHVHNIHIEENWMPGIARFTVEYVGLRGK